MQFKEKKLKTRYKYFVEDSFGKMEISSKKRLVEEDDKGNIDYSLLDDVFMAIYNTHIKEPKKIINSKVAGHDIKYKWEKVDMWEDLEDGKEKINLSIKYKE